MVKVQTKKGEKELKTSLPHHLEEEKKEKKHKERRGPKLGTTGPPIQKSGGYCSYEDKHKNVKYDDKFNIIKTTVNNIKLDINYSKYSHLARRLKWYQ